jgi:hypothetical protein
MANKQDFIVKHGITVLSTDTSTGTTTGAIITPGGAGIGGSVNIGGDIRVQGVNLLNYDDHVIYVSDGTGNDTTGDGRRVQSAFATIKHALSQAVTGDVVYIEAGTYTEIFPLTIPQGVTLRGAGLREVTVQPTVGTNQNDAFYLNGECKISDFTVVGFYKPGYAFKFAPGAKITTRSPYIERFSVITRGSTVTASDPFGYASADAGNGAYLDAGILDPTSLEPAMLWNEATFIVPNATGFYMTNGARSELLNGFFYFADKAIQAEVGALGYGGVGKTKLRLNNITGIFTPGDTLYYQSNTGTTLATGVIDTVENDYIYIQGPSWGFKTFIEAGTGTQVVYTTGTNAATATQITLADYHQFGAELRCIGSAAVFGNQGAIANGTGTDLKLIAFNLSHIGSGGDLSNDTSKTVQANEIQQTNGGKIYFQTVDQDGDFRVGDAFVVNQRTGDVSFGTATVALSQLSNLTITDGIYSTTLLPQSIQVGNLTFSGGQITTNAGDITLDPAGARVLINSDTTVQGSFTVTNVLNGASSQNATSTTTGAIRTLGGLSTVKDVWVGGNLNVTDPNTTATIANLYVSGTAFIPGGFTATSFTSTELTVVGPAVLNQLTATLSTLTELTVINDTRVGGNLSVTGTSNLSVVNGTTGTFDTLTALSTANAVSTSSGALQVRGGASIGRDLFVGGSAYLSGDLYVDGTQFAVSSNSIITGDKTITLASATTTAALASNSGIQIGASGAWASFLFNGTAAWISKGSLVASASTYNLGSLTVPWNTLYANTVYDNSNRVITTVTPTSGLGISVTNTQTIGPAASFTINNTGVLSLTAGTDTAVSVSAGDVTVWNTANLQSVTGRGATTNQAIRITNATSATSTSTGSLVVSGGVGIGGAIYAGGIISSNGALVWTTATLTDNNQLTNGAGYLTSSTIGLYGVSRINAGTGISVSANTGTVIVTNIGVVSLQGSNHIALSASSGSGVTVYNLGVTNATAGSGISVSTSTGTVNIASIDTLQLVTARGATTNQPLAITATNVSASTSTGQALAVSGGIGALRVTASEVFDNGTRVLTSILPIGGTAISISGVSTNGPQYTFTINNRGVTEAVGSAYISVSTSTGSVVITNLGVQTLTAGTDTAVSSSTGTVTVWNTSTLATVTSRGATTPSAITITNTANATSTNTGALQVVGGFGVAGSGFVGGDFTIVGQLNANVVLGSISTATNIAGGAIGGIPYQYAIGKTSLIGIGSAGSLLVSNGTTATWVTTASILVQAAQFAVTATNVAGGIVTATSAIITGAQSTSTTTGALQVVGGVGVSGSIYVGNRVGFVNATNTSSVYQVYNAATNSLDTVFG